MIVMYFFAGEQKCFALSIEIAHCRHRGVSGPHDDGPGAAVPPLAHHLPPLQSRGARTASGAVQCVRPRADRRVPLQVPALQQLQPLPGVLLDRGCSGAAHSAARGQGVHGLGKFFVF